MGQEILVRDLLDEGERFVCDFDQVCEVSVAYWVVPAESSRAFLYVASDEINDATIGDRYGDVIRLIRGSSYIHLDSINVKLVNTTDLSASDALRLRNEGKGTFAVWYGRTWLGNIGIDNCYIYPPIHVLKQVPST